jgi:two-component system, OmpR family, sensor kinase
MLRTLYARLALTLLALFLGIGCVFTLLMVYTMDLHQQEVSQKLHRDLAGYVVAHNDLNFDGAAAQALVNELFESLMVVNPNVEVYMVDLDGRIVAYSAKPGTLKRMQVDLAPIRRFIADAELPVFGDDPRQPGGHKIFSAAPVMKDGEVGCYLYIIAGGERYDSIASMLRGSYILRLSSFGLAAATVFAALAGLAVFALLTRRLRRLSHAVRRFEREGHLDPAALRAPARAGGDEIDHLTAAFREMAECIAERMDDLEQADRLRRELVANVSHDLRTPLASLQGYLDTVLMKHDVLDESERRAYVEIAARHSRRLAGLVSELFELAYLDANDRPPEREAFSLEDLAQDVAQEFALQTREAGVTLEVAPAPDLPLVYGNIAMIERVLENLIRNALRHTPAGGAVRLLLTPRETGVEVRVSDTGCGICAEDMPYIFDRFYQPHQERESAEGVGLGLAIARRILELHGSHIGASSEPQRGATFTFSLPVAGAARMTGAA